MSLVQAFRAEFDHEMASTRQLLALAPEGKSSFRPHVKSWTLGELARHIANPPTWTARTLEQSEFDFASIAGLPRPTFESAKRTLAIFDENVAAARTLLARASDADLGAAWSLKNGGTVMFTMPKSTVLRSFIMSHIIHHRGQLTVYLRMCDVPLPSTYGPTADVGI